MLKLRTEEADRNRIIPCSWVKLNQPNALTLEQGKVQGLASSESEKGLLCRTRLGYVALLWDIQKQRPNVCVLLRVAHYF